MRFPPIFSTLLKFPWNELNEFNWNWTNSQNFSPTKILVIVFSPIKGFRYFITKIDRNKLTSARKRNWDNEVLIRLYFIDGFDNSSIDSNHFETWWLKHMDWYIRERERSASKNCITASLCICSVWFNCGIFNPLNLWRYDHPFCYYHHPFSNLKK